MIRSGSTIQYNLVRSLVEHHAAGKGVGFLDHEQAVDEKTLRELATSDELLVAKAHRPLPQILSYCDAEQAVLATTYRDLFDVAGSAKTKFGWPWESIVEGIAEGIEVHRMASATPGAIVQRYETMTSDLRGALVQLADRLNLTTQEADLDRIATENGVGQVVERLEALQGAAARRERVKGLLNRTGLMPAARRLRDILPQKLRYEAVIDTQTNLHHNHISAGQGAPGVSRQCLSADEIAEINDRFGDYLTANGYSSASPPHPN